MLDQDCGWDLHNAEWDGRDSCFWKNGGEEHEFSLLIGRVLVAD
jgi:hypothetical protein